MIILLLVSVIYAQLDHLRESELGSTLLETVQLHIEANEPTGNLLDFLNGISEKLIKQKKNQYQIQNKKLDECFQKIQDMEQLLANLRDEKFDVREEIYTYKPHIEQYTHMINTKNKEKQSLIKNLEISQQRLSEDKAHFEKQKANLESKRYEYVNQKNPLPLKIDPQNLKPLMNDLVDYITDLMTMEDKYYDQKREQISKTFDTYTEQLQIVEQLIIELQNSIEETNHQVKKLELELQELNDRIEVLIKQDQLKQEQVNDIKKECNNIFQQTKASQQKITRELQTVNQISDLIEHNFGWLRAQLGV